MPTERLVAIHQPNFFPWLGFFDKLRRADVFIVLDSVQFPKTGGTYLNRVQLLVAGARAWVTMPVSREYSGTRRIDEMKIDERAPWRKKLSQTIRSNYGRATHFEETFALVSRCLDDDAKLVREFNLSTIRVLATAFGIDTVKIVCARDLAAEGTSTDLLVSLTRAVGGTTYLSGDGAGGYQDANKFAEAGLGIVFQQFKHPVYPQRPGRDFVGGLSCIDAMMCCGVAQIGRLLDVTSD